MTNKVLRELHENLSDDLDRIGRHFKNPVKITLIVRNPGMGDADVYLTDDDFELAIAAVRSLQARESTLVVEMDASMGYPEVK